MLPAKISNKVKSFLLASAIACTLGLISMPAQAQGNLIAQLPPALRAAIQSGSAQAVSQAITVLSGGDATKSAALANSAVAAAEQLLQTNPAAAVAIAGAAVNIIQNLQVTKAAPGTALEVVTIAARILVNPGAQQANPAAVGILAGTVSKIATNPAVQSINPAGAINVLANAYAAATSSYVTSESPGIMQQVTSILNDSKKNSTLVQSYVDWPQKIDQILNSQGSNTNTRITRETDTDTDKRNQLNPPKDQDQRQLGSPT